MVLTGRLLIPHRFSEFWRSGASIRLWHSDWNRENKGSLIPLLSKVAPDHFLEGSPAENARHWKFSGSRLALRIVLEKRPSRNVGVLRSERITGHSEVGRPMADSGFVLANVVAFTDLA